MAKDKLRNARSKSLDLKSFWMILKNKKVYYLRTKKAILLCLLGFKRKNKTNKRKIKTYATNLLVD